MNPMPAEYAREEAPDLVHGRFRLWGLRPAELLHLLQAGFILDVLFEPRVDDVLEGIIVICTSRGSS